MIGIPLPISNPSGMVMMFDYNGRVNNMKSSVPPIGNRQIGNRRCFLPIANCKSQIANAVDPEPFTA
jgi:hypothetical protein